MIAEYYLKRYCAEDISLIENYEEAKNDMTQMWECHHKLEIELDKTPKELQELGLYFNRPAKELILLTCKSHMQLHSYRISNGLIGNKNRLNKPFSDEGKKKISIALTGKPANIRGRIGISRNGVKKYINPNDFEIYHANGWQKGFKS